MLARIRTSLPAHPTLTHPDGTPVRPLGVSRSGRLIWPVRGGAPDDDEGKDDDGDGGKDDEGKDDDGDGGKDDEGKDDDDRELGPAGTKALEAEKKKRREAQAALREFRELGLSPADLKKLVDKGAGSSKDEGQPDVERLKTEARAEAARELQRERVLDKIEAKAARLFKDPDDAAALLLRSGDLNDFLGDDGKIDVDEIEDGLKALLEKKPYLGVDAQSDDKRRFKGGGDGGTRNGGDGRPKQLTRDDLKRMSPQEIEKARVDGRLADLLSGKK